MHFDVTRIWRTAIQAGVGALISLLTAVMSDFSMQSVITAVINFIGTVIMAVLMNMKTQLEESDPESVINIDSENDDE